MSTTTGMSRRDLLRDAAAVGTLAAAAGPTTALGAKRRRRARQHVAVIGGGMAGLTAAHELLERGFAVTIYEAKALGGKARSMPVPGSATDGRKPLPGEHGFRFFPGFYHHVPDSMRRIPFAGNAGGVRDNLVSAPLAVISLRGQADLTLPFGFTAETPGAVTPQAFAESLIAGAGLAGKVPPHELAIFVNRIAIFLSSCDERRFGQWEQTSWLDFVQAEGKSENYRKLLAAGLTRGLVAAKEHIASARTIGNMAEAFLLNMVNRGNDGDPDRVLNAPTNEAWIDPWVAYLQGLGVTIRMGWRVRGLEVAGGRITGAFATDRRGRRRRIEADHFVSAVPVEQAVKLLSPKLLKADPDLAKMRELFADWMTGIQFFLTRDAPLTAGHMAYMDTPWSLTSINQAQFWDGRDIAADYGDGTVKDILSVDISDWDTPGLFNGKIAKHCTAEEVATEVWEQIKASVNDTDPGRLRDEDLHSWHLDPAVRWHPAKGRNSNSERLLINTVGSWEHRPEPHTKIPNLFMAGDMVRNTIDLATMEGANESARAAVNALLETTGSKAERCTMYTLHQPPEMEPFKALDREQWKAGRPHGLDVPT